MDFPGKAKIEPTKFNIVASDLDGTVADIDTAMVEKYASYFKVSKQEAYQELFVKTDYDHRHPFIKDVCYEDPDFWLNMKPRDSVKGLVKYRCTNKYVDNPRLYFITARPGFLRDVTEQWVDKHFGILGYDGIMVDTKDHKLDACLYIGAQIIFDDRWKEMKPVLQAGVPVGMMKQPYNLVDIPKSEKYDNIYWIDDVQDLGPPFK